MKKIKLFILLCAINFTLTIFACATYYTGSYIADDKEDDIYNNFEHTHFQFKGELLLIAKQTYPNTKNWTKFKKSLLSKKEANEYDIKDKINKNKISKNIMLEFELYEKGVSEMIENKSSKLKYPISWLKLLKLPENERKYRTSWVLFMLGNMSSCHKNAEKASEYYKKLRNAVKNGFTDTLGLAYVSYKNEYKAFTNHNKRITQAVKAIAFYQIVNDKKIQRDIILDIHWELNTLKNNQKDKFLTNNLARKVNIIHHNSNNSNPKIPDDFINILKKSSNGQELIARTAWMCYKKGLFERAKKYINYTTKNSLLALWVKARLAMRNGEKVDSEKYLKLWIKLLAENKSQIRELQGVAPTEEDIYGLLGHVIIHRNDFDTALACFIRSKEYTSIAYIAEKLMTISQLEKFIEVFSIINEKNSEQLEHLYYLFARRLMRNKEYVKALKYCPKEYHQLFTKYILLVNTGNDKNLSNNERALAYYNTGKLLFIDGWEICGTSLWPDALYPDIEKNWAITHNFQKIAVLQNDEDKKISNIRFHYKMRGLEFMRKVTKLTDDDKLKFTANIFSGYKLYAVSPDIADNNYKNAVNCKSVLISKDFDIIRWFPFKDSLPKIMKDELNNVKPIKSIKEFEKITQGRLTKEDIAINLEKRKEWVAKMQEVEK